MSARWEHVDFDEATLHIPDPKGGIAKAFTIPLSTQLLDFFAEIPRTSSPWVFPAVSKTGHMYTDREPSLPIRPHEFRSYYTVAVRGENG